MASKMKDRKVCAPCALGILRTEIIWNLALLKTFEYTVGIICFSIYS